MKTIKHISFILLVILLSFGCKKEHPPTSTVSTPDFYFNGTIGGTSTSFSAGVNNYYMYSSYLQDSNNVYGFIGDLKQTTSNASGIQIQIYNYTVSVPNGSVNINSSLQVSNYPYYIPDTSVTPTTTITAYQVQFNSSYTNGTPQTYNWDFGDGNTSALANPVHVYSSLGYYNVCLNITGTNSCSNSICDTLNLSSPSSYSCHAAISSSVLPGTNTANFYAIPTGTAPFNFFWNFGDSITASYSSPADSANHTYASPGTYQVSLRVTDATSKVSIAKYNVTTALAPATCITNFSVSTIQTVTTVTPNTTGGLTELGKVVVTWTDASGVVYTSNNIAQPNSSNFQIISVDSYADNTNNQHTKKLHVKFNCWVYNNSHPPIQITNADAIIAVAYK